MNKDYKSDDVKLESLDLPCDLKKLSYEECDSVCSQIREKLINTVSKNGGHLASNLGTVELSVSLHRVFNSPSDKIVWDVGHQAYTHKILTGRLDKFDTLRKEDGLSGFLRPSESEHDPYVSGHSSNSISVALGMAYALKAKGDNSHAIAIVGDGALTGGLAFEGLNNAGKSGTNLIVILNHNEMSISKNIGALAKYLSKLRTQTSYNKTKNVMKNVVEKVPLIGPALRKTVHSSKNAVKGIVLHSTMFEELGFKFLGPVDGHNVEELDRVLNLAKSSNCPTFIHVNTVKGKGYAPAESNPGEYHGVGKFEVATGNPDVVSNDSYSNVFGEELTRLANDDKRIFAITAAMKYGTGLHTFAHKHKDRFFDVGIAEEHAVSFCSGLSRMGMIPVFAVYSTFLQRSYDQLLHDLSLDGVHIVLGIDRAGIVGEDGETHQGLYDVNFLRTIPNMTLFSPSNYEELRLCLKEALYNYEGIVGVRYPRGKGVEKFDFISSNTEYSYMDNDSESIILTYGRLFENVYNAAEMLKTDGIKTDILKLTKIWPVDIEIIDLVSKYKNVFVFEEGSSVGSLGEFLSSKLATNGFKGKIFINGIDDIIKHMSTQSAMKLVKLDSQSIFETVKRGIEQNL